MPDDFGPYTVFFRYKDLDKSRSYFEKIDPIAQSNKAHSTQHQTYVSHFSFNGKGNLTRFLEDTLEFEFIRSIKILFNEKRETKPIHLPTQP